MPPDPTEAHPPVHDGLRLAVQFRLNQGKGDVLSAVSGIPLKTLEEFAETGKIAEQLRNILEMLQ